MCDTLGSLGHSDDCSPVVGVLCIDVATKLHKHYGQQVRSYIAASYVKYLEAQGAQVIPIWIGRERHYYVHILNKVNGVLLPGGAVFIDAHQATAETPNACVQSAAWIIDIALEMNARGVHMPIWGTCLGYQLLLLLHTATVRDTTVADFRSECTKMQCTLPWQLAADYRGSRLLQPMAESQLTQYQTNPIAVHYHQYCITPERFAEHQCSTHWRILATQRDRRGLVFITMVEHKQYPFYGVQFHPECTAYETNEGNNDCKEVAISAAHYLAAYFVAECRKSPTRPMTAEEYAHYSIHQYDVVDTALPTEGRWQQCYLFPGDVDYPTLAKK